jgi:hypothetical protein
MNHPYQVAFGAGHGSSGLRMTMSNDGLTPSIGLAAVRPRQPAENGEDPAAEVMVIGRLDRRPDPPECW